MCENFARVHAARQELCLIAGRLQTCPDHDVPETYHSLLKTAERMFGAEQQLMEDYAFPVRQAHLEQHARVLRGLHRVHAVVLQGAANEGRHIGGRLLMDWLRLHQDTIDAAFTVWASYCDSGLIDPHNQDLSASSSSLTAH